MPTGYGCKFCLHPATVSLHWAQRPLRPTEGHVPRGHMNSARQFLQWLPQAPRHGSAVSGSIHANDSEGPAQGRHC